MDATAREADVKLLMDVIIRYQLHPPGMGRFPQIRVKVSPYVATTQIRGLEW